MIIYIALKHVCVRICIAILNINPQDCIKEIEI